MIIIVVIANIFQLEKKNLFKNVVSNTNRQLKALIKLLPPWWPPKANPSTFQLEVHY